MADIAFLLLIFFLVTTTISADKGILRKLPKLCPEGQTCGEKLLERNVLRILINDNQEIMIEDEIVSILEVKDLAKNFIDNNGNRTCEYCKGNQLDNSSTSPKNAVISIQHGTLTKYQLFIEVQDELTKAYYELREEYAKSVYNKSPYSLSQEEMKAVKDAYPFILSEAKTIRAD